MDNLYDILVVLFLVFSILSSLFNKSKQEKNTKTGRPPVRTQRPVSSGPIVLENPGMNRSEPSSEISYNKGEFEEKRPGFDVLPGYDTRKDFEKLRPRTLRTEFPGIPEISKTLEINRESRTITVPSKPAIKPADNIYRGDLNKMLRHPATLRDAFILSEILGKPKALRK